MIRRELHDQLWWISQAQRCAVAAKIAEHVGNQRFLAISPKVAIAAANLDAGWTQIDLDQPARDATELNRGTVLELWQSSGDRAATVDPYAGLLVTLAGFWKSMAAGGSGLAQWDANDTRVRFDLNRFQHAMIERMEALRLQCGLRIDKPLKFGLAENSRDSAEKQLRIDFNWLQTIDTLSAALCRGGAPAMHLIAWARGNKSVELIADVHSLRATVNPWPFDLARIELPILAHPADGAAEARWFTIELAAFTI